MQVVTMTKEGYIKYIVKFMIPQIRGHTACYISFKSSTWLKVQSNWIMVSKEFDLNPISEIEKVEWRNLMLKVYILGWTILYKTEKI